MLDGPGEDVAAARSAQSPPASFSARGPWLPWRETTLAQRLVLLVVAVALPLFGLVGWSVWAAQQGVRQQLESALLLRLHGIVLAVERDFDRAEALLQALAASAALARGDLAAVEEEMRAASSAFDGAPVTLLGRDGLVVLSTLWPRGEPQGGVSAVPDLRRVIEGGRARVTNLFEAPSTGELSIAFGLPIAAAAPAGADSAGVPAGIGLNLPRQRLAATLRSAAALQDDDATRGWTASMIDRRGISVARTVGEQGVVGTSARREILEMLDRRAPAILHGLTTRDGRDVVTAFTRGPSSGYAYILTMPLAEFAAPLRAALLRMALGGGMVFALGVGLASALARNIVAAFRVARNAGDGDAAPARTGLREADELARALVDTSAGRHRAEQRTREVLESLGERLYSMDREGRVRFASRAALEGWGATSERLLGQRFQDVFPGVAGSATWEATRAALADRQEVHVCGVSPLLGRWIEVDAYPTSDQGITVAFRDIDDLRRAHREGSRVTQALRDAEERQRLALEAAELGSWEVDLRAGTVRRSARTLEIFGFDTAAEVEAYPSWRGRIHRDDRQAALQPIQDALAGRIEAYRVEYRFLRPDGRWIWVESHGRVVARDPATQRVSRLAGATRDVTERRAGEERQKLLMRELDHRAKNALAVVQAAVRLTSKSDPHEFAAAVEGRVAALARAHALLAEGRWSGASLRAVVEAELAAFLGAGRLRTMGPSASFEGPDVMLAPSAAQSISMAVHELGTNATKYGAFSVPMGRVRITWEIEPATAWLRLRWEERGGPPVRRVPQRRGFGSRVIELIVRTQLAGTLEQDWEEAGLVCVIRLPLSRIEATSAEEPATIRAQDVEMLTASGQDAQAAPAASPTT